LQSQRLLNWKLETVRSPNGDVVSSLIISAETIERALLFKRTITLALTPDGQTTAVIPDCAECIQAISPIDNLVGDVLDPTNLCMEEATAADLRTLLQRLERSVSLVREAIDRMTSAPKARC